MVVVRWSVGMEKCTEWCLRIYKNQQKLFFAMLKYLKTETKLIGLQNQHLMFVLLVFSNFRGENWNVNIKTDPDPRN